MQKLISQSLMKMVLEYKAKQKCGHLLKAKLVDELDLDDSTDSMRLGTYTEYIAFGNLNRAGQIPKAVFNKSNGAMRADYARAHECAQLVKQWMFNMGFVVIKKAWYVKSKTHEGTIDLLVRCTKKITFTDGFVLNVGDEIVIDFKYSGLLDDRWSKHGWSWTPIQLEYHGIQAKQYHMLTKKPFFFLVKDSSAQGVRNVKFFRMIVSEESIEKHKALGAELYDYLDHLTKVGFEPYPSIDACSDCPLKAKCPDKAEYPQAEAVSI